MIKNAYEFARNIDENIKKMSEDELYDAHRLYKRLYIETQYYGPLEDIAVYRHAFVVLENHLHLEFFITSMHDGAV